MTLEEYCNEKNIFIGSGSVDRLKYTGNISYIYDRNERQLDLRSIGIYRCVEDLPEDFIDFLKKQTVLRSSEVSSEGNITPYIVELDMEIGDQSIESISLYNVKLNGESYSIVDSKKENLNY